MFCIRVGSNLGVQRAAPLYPILRRLYATQDLNSRKDLDISHSHFLAEASPKSKWNDEVLDSSKRNGKAAREDELQGVTNTQGKLSPTSSHLFKLILPLGSLSHPSNTFKEPESSNKNSNSPTSKSQTKIPHVPPTVLLLHPSQPLSHVSRLILASLAPATPSISFRSNSSQGQAFQWSDSTDLGDFIKDAARSAEFTICISYGPKSARKRLRPASEHSGEANTDTIPVDAAKEAKEAEESGITEMSITVTVPTFADRTRFLRRRLSLLEGRLNEMEALKRQCDEEAHYGARKMALGGFGMLVVYWAAVARLTFWDYGWDIMEPITYLSGLSTVILGYLWFLYQGREVSYTSVLARSISARREALYKVRGLDIEHWTEFMSERKALRQEISRIALDYEGDEEGGDNPGKGSTDAESDQDSGSDDLKSESESVEDSEQTAEAALQDKDDPKK
ncbi:hypothetical protein GALMADRAFT_225317 [Galerina marginata CBS 339.88]|uniref:Calcium uniporter protein, mitochondrial n=1 Tax=Galerina marginata (strain CBS 339.88) TaxID=685588 RepID=A0A067T4A7_GALM3|nr:hypothetical protein GALMADRAFT_225317 [Galerina marginata CBS 339.88]